MPISPGRVALEKSPPLMTTAVPLNQFQWHGFEFYGRPEMSPKRNLGTFLTTVLVEIG